MRLLALMLALSGCRAIKDAAYPDFYEVRFVDGSKATGAVWQCVRETRDAGDHRRADVLECSNLVPLFETLTGAKSAPDWRM